MTAQKPCGINNSLRIYYKRHRLSTASITGHPEALLKYITELYIVGPRDLHRLITDYYFIKYKSNILQ